MVAYHVAFSLLIVQKRSDVMMVRCYQQEYRQKFCSLIDVIIKVENIKLDDITSIHVLRYTRT